MKNTPKEFEGAIIDSCRNAIDTFDMASLWYSLVRTDQRPVI